MTTPYMLNQLNMVRHFAERGHYFAALDACSRLRDELERLQGNESREEPWSVDEILAKEG